MVESIKRLTDKPESIFECPCVRAGLGESLRVLMKLPESIGTAAFHILVHSSGQSGHDEVSKKLSVFLGQDFNTEDISLWVAMIIQQANNTNGLSQSANYRIGNDGTSALLDDHKFLIMIFLSKIEARCYRLRAESNPDVRTIADQGGIET